MNYNVSGSSVVVAATAVKKNGHFHIYTVTLEYRHEKKVVQHVPRIIFNVFKSDFETFVFISKKIFLTLSAVGKSVET